MATLITIASRTLNLDQVTEIIDQGDTIRVLFAVGLYKGTIEQQELDYSEFRGEDAELLRWWLEHNATDVAKVKATKIEPPQSSSHQTY